MMLELKNERIYNPFYLIDTESILGSTNRNKSCKMQLCRDLYFMNSLMHTFLEYLNIACNGQHDFMNEIDILSCHVFE